MALFCAAIRRNSVCILRFTIPSHVHVFSCVILLAGRLKCPYSSYSGFLVISVLLMLTLSCIVSGHRSLSSAFF